MMQSYECEDRSLNSDSPHVSAVIPTYNGEEFVTDAIDSVLKQTYEDFELVVIDDGSTDKTVDIVKSYEDDRITLHENDENQGIAGNMNRGVEIAEGSLFAFLDQDDYWRPKKLGKHVAAHDDAALVYSDIDVVTVDGTRIERVRPPDPKPAGNPLVEQLYTHVNFIRTFSGVTIRRDAWESIGGLDTSLTTSADYDLYCRLAEHFGFEHVSDILTIKRQHESNASNDSEELYRDACTILERVQKRHPNLISELTRSQWRRYGYERAFRAFRAGQCKEARHFCRLSLSNGLMVSALLLFAVLSLDIVSGPLQFGTRGYRLYKRFT